MLPFKNDTFDYYVISFGIRNVSNLNKSLNEEISVIGKKSINLPLGEIKITRKVKALEKIATNAGHTMTELAISWLLSKDVVSSVISGATKTEQVEINVKAAEWELDTSIIEEIEIILND